MTIPMLLVINEEQLLKFCADMVTLKACNNLLPVVNEILLYNKFKTDFFHLQKENSLSKQMPQEDTTVKEAKNQKMEEKQVRKAIQMIHTKKKMGKTINRQILKSSLQIQNLLDMLLVWFGIRSAWPGRTKRLPYLDIFSMVTWVTFSLLFPMDWWLLLQQGTYK